MKKLILTCILSLSLLVASSPVSALESKTTSVTLSSGKKAVTYVLFHPSEPLELKPVLAHNKVGLTEELAKMAQRNQAVAAINGTFFNPYDTKDLQPLGALAINQRMEHFRGGPVALGITQQNELWFDATKSIAIRGSINGSEVWPHNWYAWFINHAPTSQDEIVIFTPSYRSAQLDFPQFSFVVVNDGKVTSISKNKATIPAKGFVIAYGSNPTNQDQLQRFQVGDTVSYQVVYPDGIGSPQHLLSAGPKLVTNGKISLDSAGFTEDKITKNPGQRSFIGMKADQTILFGTVSNVTMKELAQLVIKLGLTEAMNLDGGASSGLYYNGKYLTKPGRLLSNSLVLVKKEKIQAPAIQVMINGVPQRYDQRSTSAI
ncbi:phosphodiester glycosidase family protein [Ammoniphilus sp. YIM 78166]|uniref:phosphodiester glycosidase family protein n=1 Tax=Ammoniphilus sp. YIM 78166 TaxID=1644106 RepID=UPI00107051FE|nr:phosphodiester glycosidase family protein [Ammoniphilus sp. YIM 78166]